jgi:hypothetical protein
MWIRVRVNHFGGGSLASQKRIGVVQQCQLIVCKRISGEKVTFRPGRTNAYKHLYFGGGKLFRGLRFGHGLDDQIYMFQESQQHGTMFGREVRLILLNVLLNVRHRALTLVNAICKDAE